MTTDSKTKTVSWFDYLPYNVRLCLVQCQKTKSDLPILLNVKWQWAQDAGHYRGHTKSDILANILDLLGCDRTSNITELTTEEWRNLTK